MAFNSLEDVDEWVKAHSVDELRDAVASSSRLHPRNREWARRWLEREIAKGALAREDEQHDFMRRQTVAAEESATAAKVSARWAVLGGVIAAAMLVATAWPYFKLVDLLVRLGK